MTVSALQLSIVLPCYNEVRNLPLLLERYAEVWEPLPAELVLVDNGSTDGTADFLTQELRKPEYSFARVVRVEVNRGYGYGIAAGLAAARGAFVGFSHADMQCSPKDLFRAYHRLTEDPDPETLLVKGLRARRALGDEIVTGVMSLLASAVLCQRYTDINAQPKVFPRQLLEHLQQPPSGFQFDLYVLHQARRHGMRIATLPVEFGERAHGESKWKHNLFVRYRTILSTIAYIFRLRFQSR